MRKPLPKFQKESTVKVGLAANSSVSLYTGVITVLRIYIK